jgi:phosphoserine phosphatase RsbU/P
MALLQALSGNDVSRIYEIARPSLLVGRSHQNDIWDIFGKDDRVSRFQAQIDKVGEQYVLAHKGHNPTTVNSVPVENTKVLRHGDIIGIVKWNFRFCESESGIFKLKPGDTKDTQDAHVASAVQSRIDIESDGSSASQSPTSTAGRLKALLGALVALGKSLDLADLLTGLLAEVLKIFPAADTCLVCLRSQASGELEPAASLLREPGKIKPHLSQTIVADVLRAKQAILYSDFENKEFHDSYSVREVGIRSAMCVPLLVDDKVIGVLQVDTRQPGKGFRKDDLEVLTSIATLINLAIRHAELHQRLVNERALEYELSAAQKVQRNFLPNQVPVIAGYEFFPYYNAALQVGGDYYDYIWLPDGRLAVVLADASGKGTSAALFMAAVSGELKCSLLTEKSASAALNKLNRCICDRPESRFVTMAVAILNPADHSVTILNAGHMPPLHRRADGKVEELAAKLGGLPLGVERDETYEETVIKLGPGESILMFTDGFTDAENTSGQHYEKARLLAQVSSACTGLAELGRQMVRDVHEFMGMHPQYDDMCLTCFGRQA